MSVPSDLLYTEEHEWVRKDDDGVVTVGITSFAQDQLGAIVYVELPDDGVEVARGDSIGQIESTKSVSDIYAPLSGQILEINGALEGAPELLNSNPYEDGWIIRIRMESPEELDELLRAGEYTDHIAES